MIRSLLLMAMPTAWAHDGSKTCSFLDAYPRRYPVYNLGTAKVTVDGRLDEAAWAEVPWSEPFVDIQGPQFWSQPWFSTRVKMRYDDTFLYIGAYMEETEVWANMTHRNDVVFYDNDFEIFVDPTGSTHGYKEFEINAINTTWNLLLDKPYRDDGHENSTRVDPVYGFDLLPFGLHSAVYMKGSPNIPQQRAKYWTTEVALPLEGLVAGTAAVAPPRDKSFWRINFSRVEYVVQVVDDAYQKVPGLSEENWAWSPQGAIAMHMPEKWGYVQFRNEAVPKDISPVPYDEHWAARYLAFQVYYAQAACRSKTKAYAATLAELTPFFMTTNTAEVLGCLDAHWTVSTGINCGDVKQCVSNDSFVATVCSQTDKKRTARITQDGHLTVTFNS
uniref:Secreted protein n=1 Tax=Achlya hypogyna TaxID=1202772 RepID=A0A0A7CN12_ACHHY|nr:secreted protein [Achlya hypogyna]